MGASSMTLKKLPPKRGLCCLRATVGSIVSHCCCASTPKTSALGSVERWSAGFDQANWRSCSRAQKRPQRFRETQFLELLYRAWRRLAGANWHGTGSGPVVGLADIHEILTLLPGTDYPIEEFGRDLLLLDRRPDLRTRDGCRFEFPASTLSRGRMKRVSVYDERGGERTYIGIRFVKEG